MLMRAKTILIRIENSLGQLIHSSQEISFSHWKKEIDLDNPSSGLYVLEIKTNEGFSRSKIIVTK